jgi:hypothetical protein
MAAARWWVGAAALAAAGYLWWRHDQEEAAAAAQAARVQLLQAEERLERAKGSAALAERAAAMRAVPRAQLEAQLRAFAPPQREVAALAVGQGQAVLPRPELPAVGKQGEVGPDGVLVESLTTQVAKAVAPAAVLAPAVVGKLPAEGGVLVESFGSGAGALEEF